MRCPYCNCELSAESKFCDKCGQELRTVADSSQTSKNYWEDYQKKVEKEVLLDREMVAQTKKQNRKARNATIICITICLAILAAIAFLIVSKNKANKKILENIHEQMVGQEYDDSEDNILWHGDDTDRCIITILSEDQLEFIEGNYKMLLDDDNHITWTENEIYRKETHTYSLSISFFGKVSIAIQGRDYEVEIWDDGSVRMIHVYED